MKTRDGPFSAGFNFQDICIAVYVKVDEPDHDWIRRDLMTYVGGQSKFYCSEHGVPLISSYKSKQKCVWRIDHISRDYCERKVTLCCPELHCSVGICNKCTKENDNNELCHVLPPSYDNIIFKN